MSIFSNNKNEELMLVFNIGSSSVGVTLFRAQKSGIPKIIFSFTELIFVKEQMDIDHFLSLTIKALEIMVDKVYKAGLGAPSKVFCVLSAPWQVSQTRIINLKRNTPFVFNTKIADELMQKEIKLFEEENIAKYGSSVRTIEVKNIKTMLNGYETSQPLNKKTKELDMTIFISISGEKVLKEIEKAISKHYHSNKIIFSSFTMASFTVVRDMFTNSENFLLVDIGGEITDVSMTKKKILTDSASFPLGLNFLTRGVASALACTLDEANSLISLFKDGHGDELTNQKLLPIIDKLKAQWLKSFQDSLANLSHDISIPATIYIATDKDFAEFFSEIIKTEKFNQYTLTESKFEVIFLSNQTLHGAAMFEENVVRDTFLIIDAIYINRFLFTQSR